MPWCGSPKSVPPLQLHPSMPRTALIGATRDSPVFRIRVSRELADAWEAHCQRKGKSQHAVVRQLMRYVIQDDMPPEVREWVSRQIEPPDEGPKKRVVVQLTPSEHAAIEARAEAERVSIQRWLICAARASLTHQPQFTLDAAIALGESSLQLRAVGRNLNQIAKRLNEVGVGAITLEVLQALRAYIEEHTAHVAALQEASLRRWRIADDGATHAVSRKAGRN